MSKKVAQEAPPVADQSMSDGCQQILNMSLDRISDNNKKLMESTSQFFATYFSVTNEITNKCFDGQMARSHNFNTGSNSTKTYEEETAKNYKGTQDIENSIRLNNKLILDTIQLAVATNRLYYSTLMNNLPMHPPTFFKYQQSST